MAGRKPKPREVQIAEGRHLKNPGRFVDEVPETLSTEPQMPEHLDDRAQAEWQRLEEIMRAGGTWSATYQTAIEIYCETYSNYRRALDLVRATGQALRQTAADGQVEIKRNPYSVELHKYKEETIKLMTELGITPSSRSRVKLPGGADADDPMMRLLA